jgi:hypothetical protein
VNEPDDIDRGLPFRVALRAVQMYKRREGHAPRWMFRCVVKVDRDAVNDLIACITPGSLLVCRKATETNVPAK